MRPSGICSSYESPEVLAARLAAERADRVGLDLLAAQLDIARKPRKRRDGTAIAAANARRHINIVDLAANPLRESLQARVQCHEHEELLAAIAEHHPDRAAVSAFHHVRTGRAQRLGMAAQWSRAGGRPCAAPSVYSIELN
jgi:DNA-binding GntR family transcriptional regulator